MSDSDSLKGKNGKVRVMYVRKDDEQEQTRRPAPRSSTSGRDSGKRGEGRGVWDKSGDRNRGGARQERSSTSADAPYRSRGDRSNAPRGDHAEGPYRSRGDRPDAPRGDRAEGPYRSRGDRSDTPRGDRADAPRRDRDDTPYRDRGDVASRAASPRRERSDAADSPWKTFYAGDEDAGPDHGGISGKSQIDPEQLRRQRAEETRVYGENACQALFRNRPEAIVRAWFVQSVTPRFRDALRWMAANRKAYHVVEDDELAKASGTEHHGGVCFLIKKRAGLDASGYLESAVANDNDCVLALEQVSNPHNLGAMLRSCAHFGVNGVMIGDSAQLESGAAVRTAEGGAEHVNAIQTDDLLADLDRFRRAGYTIVTVTGQGGTPLSAVKMPARTVLVLGEENTALSEAVQSQADTAVAISGTGRVPSLNLSVSAGILLSEWWRQNR